MGRSEIVFDGQVRCSTTNKRPPTSSPGTREFLSIYRQRCIQLHRNRTSLILHVLPMLHLFSARKEERRGVPTTWRKRRSESRRSSLVSKLTSTGQRTRRCTCFLAHDMRHASHTPLHENNHICISKSDVCIFSKIQRTFLQNDILWENMFV